MHHVAQILEAFESLLLHQKVQLLWVLIMNKFPTTTRMPMRVEEIFELEDFAIYSRFVAK